MSKLVWDVVGEREYETGVNKGVLYPQVSGQYPKGYAWNGLTGVTESPSGAEATAIWADNMKYLNLRSIEEFGGTITAYTCPVEFYACDGSDEIATGVVVGQQTRQAFGMCYRTNVGNDTDGDDHGYKLHLIYGATVTPSERAYATINDSPEAIELSWTFDTVPVNVTGFKPTALITIDSTKCSASKLATLEEKLYGTTADDPYLPLPDEVITIMGGAVAPVITSVTMTNVTLNPSTWSSSTTTYTGTTTSTSTTITATGTTGATIAIKNGTSDVTNGGSATLTTGDNVITITITDASDATLKTVYTITVTKS